MTSGYTPMVPYVRLRTEGWTCVRCGRGHYRAGVCSACGLEVRTSVRLPLRLVRQDLRPASDRRQGAA
jgi:ribosomal protein L37E